LTPRSTTDRFVRPWDAAAITVSGDFISGYIDANDNSNLTWVKEAASGATRVRFIRIPHR
jgi:hypothetical protein